MAAKNLLDAISQGMNSKLGSTEDEFRKAIANEIVDYLAHEVMKFEIDIDRGKEEDRSIHQFFRRTIRRE